MSMAQQLYHLQELDTEIESNRQALQRMTGQLGESQVMVRLRAELSGEQERLEDLTKKQHSLEWDDEDITVKLKKAEEQLYSGRITIPKELSNLQHDIEMLRERRSKIDDKILVMMEQAEEINRRIADIGKQYKEVEAEWQVAQQKLTADIEQVKAVLAGLEQERQALVDSLDNQVNELYNDLKRTRKTAVAKVTQGTCAGCRLQLPVTDLQRVRTGNVVQCSSCGRILYLA